MSDGKDSNGKPAVVDLIDDAIVVNPDAARAGRCGFEWT
jgi:hypothetical protein